MWRQHVDRVVHIIAPRRGTSVLAMFTSMLWWLLSCHVSHYSAVTMSPMAYLITSVSFVYSTVSSDADQRKHQSSSSLTFVTGIHRWPVNSPHKGPVTRKRFPIDDVIMHGTLRIGILIRHFHSLLAVNRRHLTSGQNCPREYRSSQTFRMGEWYYGYYTK